MDSFPGNGRDTTGGTDANDHDSEGTTRRGVLRASAVAVGTVGLGVGAVSTATANGKGGEAAVPNEDFRRDEAFSFEEWTGNRVKQTCEKGGNGIVLAEWTFHYEGEETTRTIYTRDNAIDTERTYTFTGNGDVDCGGFRLVPYSRSKK